MRFVLFFYLSLALGLFELGEAAQLLYILPPVKETSWPSSKVQEVEKLLKDQLKRRYSKEVRGTDFFKEMNSKIEERKREYQGLLVSQQKKWKELQAVFKEANSQYRSSEFSNANRIYEKLWAQLPKANLFLSGNFVTDFLANWGASLYLADRKGAAALRFETIFSLGLESFFSYSRFPPALREFFRKAEKRSMERFSVQVQSNVKELNAVFMGTKLPVKKTNDDFVLKVPARNALLDSQVLSLRSKSFFPKFFKISDLPQKVELQKYEQPLPVFSVSLFDSPPSLEQRQFLDQLESNAEVLAHQYNKDDTGQYQLQLQWWKTKDFERGPVFSVRSEKLSELKTKLKDSLGSFWLNRFSRDRTSSSFETPQARLYDQWWFWSLVGVGAAGLGTGAYFLLRPEDQVVFNVTEAN